MFAGNQGEKAWTKCAEALIRSAFLVGIYLLLGGVLIYAHLERRNKGILNPFDKKSF